MLIQYHVNIWLSNHISTIMHLSMSPIEMRVRLTIIPYSLCMTNNEYVKSNNPTSHQYDAKSNDPSHRNAISMS